MTMHTTLRSLAFGALAAFSITTALRAADHGDGPTVANDQAADLGDIYSFLDPNDNDNVVVIITARGFIVPGEANNFSTFDSNIRYRVLIENSGDAKPDKFIDVTFTKRQVAEGASAPSQNAIIAVTGLKGTFTAPVTAPGDSGSTATRVITADLTNTRNATTGIKFFAGMVDDPFFFDIPGFGGFVNSVLGGSADTTKLDRARDTFAGYNIMAVALSVPKTLLLSTKVGAPTVLGISAAAQRKKSQIYSTRGGAKGAGSFVTVDREGIPGVNAVLTSYNIKDAYNASNTVADASPKNTVFAPSIVGTLTALGTNQGGIDTLAGLAVANGDMLRLDTTIANTGMGGGDNAGAGFPASGRRLKDDVIDTVINVVTNGTVTTGDKVNGNDIPFEDTFPFLAPSQQARANGVTDDGTRN